MALITCPKCHKESSDRETLCIYCGCLLERPLAQDGKATEGNNRKSDSISSRRVCVLSVLSLVTSVAAALIYSSLFHGIRIASLFIVASMISVILPAIAKKVRVNSNGKGKVFEIIAIIIGGFDFYSFVFALTKWPIFIGFLGWVVSAIVYKFICHEPITEGK